MAAQLKFDVIFSRDTISPTGAVFSMAYILSVCPIFQAKIIGCAFTFSGGSSHLCFSSVGLLAPSFTAEGGSITSGYFATLIGIVTMGKDAFPTSRVCGHFFLLCEWGGGGYYIRWAGLPIDF